MYFHPVLYRIKYIYVLTYVFIYVYLLIKFLMCLPSVSCGSLLSEVLIKFACFSRKLSKHSDF